MTKTFIFERIVSTKEVYIDAPYGVTPTYQMSPSGNDYDWSPTPSGWLSPTRQIVLPGEAPTTEEMNNDMIYDWSPAPSPPASLQLASPTIKETAVAYQWDYQWLDGRWQYIQVPYGIHYVYEYDFYENFYVSYDLNLRPEAGAAVIVPLLAVLAVAALGVLLANNASGGRIESR